jgi:DNA invertase Pin-like site-specific DNA recombinase
MNNNSRIDAIYARQSVDKKDSISIDSQIEFCRHELRGGTAKEYQDKGFSGKNTDRPQFQQLVSDIEAGLIARVVVYKLDRISRSILDFAKMMDMFQKYSVEFVSSTEKFDTSTPMGRAMLNICIVFAQLERETIQRRVVDSYFSRNKLGLYMGGPVPYGYRLEPTVINGINTKMLTEQKEKADHIRLMYEMYAEPRVSLGEIARCFAEKGILPYGTPLNRASVSQILKSPVYVRADIDIYEFYKGQGALVANDAADFTGINGCYYFKQKDSGYHNRYGFEGYELILAPHEGIISSNLWLKVRKKLLANPQFQSAKKAKATWLAGKVRCGHCGKLFSCVKGSTPYYYFRCPTRTNSKSCPGPKKLRAEDLEQFMYGQMVEKLQEFRTLTRKGHKADPKLTALKIDQAQVQCEIEKLIDSLTGASEILISYANEKIMELDAKRHRVTKLISEITVQQTSPEEMEKISGYLNNWENLGFDDKRVVLDGLVTSIRATGKGEAVEIEWKF